MKKQSKSSLKNTRRILNILVTNLENKFMNLNIYKKEEIELKIQYYECIKSFKDKDVLNLYIGFGKLSKAIT